MIAKRSSVLGRMSDLQVQYRGGQRVLWAPGVAENDKFCRCHNTPVMSRLMPFLDHYFGSVKAGYGGMVEGCKGAFCNLHPYWEKCVLYLNYRYRCDPHIPTNTTEIMKLMQADSDLLANFWTLPEDKRTKIYEAWSMVPNQPGVHVAWNVWWTWRLRSEPWTLEVQSHQWLAADRTRVLHEATGGGHDQKLHIGLIVPWGETVEDFIEYHAKEINGIIANYYRHLSKYASSMAPHSTLMRPSLMSVSGSWEKNW